MTPYTYGDAGNLVSQNQSGILIASYTYDSQNRMTTAKTYGISGTLTETYNYDALGNRIAKTTDGVKTEYLIDYSTGYAQVLRATTAGSTIFYTRGFELISRKDATRELWYLSDGGGNVRYLTDSTGSVTDSLVFDAFGNTVSRAGETGDSYGFQGEQQDATGLYYLRARYMNPATGSFTQMDTYGGSLSDPMSLHKYLFANANPVKYRDPSGNTATLVETELSIAIFSVLSAGYETNIYADNFFDQVQPGEQYDYGEYLTGAGKTFMHGFAFGIVSMVCIALVSIFAFTLIECVLCALIMLCAGIIAGFEADRLASQDNPQGAETAEYISQLCYTGSLTFVFEAGSAGGASAAEGAAGSRQELILKGTNYTEEYAQKLKYTYKIFQNNGYEIGEHGLNRIFGRINQGKIESLDQVLDALKTGVKYTDTVEGGTVIFQDGVSIHITEDGFIKTVIGEAKVKPTWEIIA